ncbi:MAG TPA: carboxymuconolactone decarboxylase family protein [Gaiellaceae bacterium]
MSETNSEKIEKIVRDRKRGHVKLSKSSKGYRLFSELDQHTFSGGALEKWQKELIALGISVHKNCEPCMEWHVNEALKSGATREQIIEALEVGIEMGGGPASVSARFAMDVLDYYEQK